MSFLAGFLSGCVFYYFLALWVHDTEAEAKDL